MTGVVAGRGASTLSPPAEQLWFPLWSAALHTCSPSTSVVGVHTVPRLGAGSPRWGLLLGQDKEGSSLQELREELEEAGGLRFSAPPLSVPGS